MLSRMSVCIGWVLQGVHIAASVAWIECEQPSTAWRACRWVANADLRSNSVQALIRKLPASLGSVCQGVLHMLPGPLTSMLLLVRSCQAWCAAHIHEQAAAAIRPKPLRLHHR
jgi:hypothetical protein